MPNLILIDGGKGQLDAAIKARDIHGFSSIPMIGLAKRHEQIIIHKAKSNIDINDEFLAQLKGYKTETIDYATLNLPTNSNLIKLLQRIRDESHRFAVSYHSVLKTKRQTASALDGIPATRNSYQEKAFKKLWQCQTNINSVSQDDIADLVGNEKAKSDQGLL
jgi:excinuclease ABC subunit C